MNGVHKIANRITLGLVLAALIVGAAMLMTVPTDFRILGYPGLAIIFFLAAGRWNRIGFGHIVLRRKAVRDMILRDGPTCLSCSILLC
jgi:hypothetical protein